MSSNKNDQGSSSSNPNPNIRPRFWHRREVLNTRPAIRPWPMSHFVRPVIPPPLPAQQLPVPYRPLLGYGTHSSAFVLYNPNQGMAIVPHRPLPQHPSGSGTHSSAFVPYNPNQGMAIVPHRPLPQHPSGFGTHSSAFVQYNPNQGMAIVPHRPLPQHPSGSGTHSSALVTHTPNQVMALVPYEGTGGGSEEGAEGGSEAGALVVYTPDIVTGAHDEGAEGSSNAGALVVHSGENVGGAEGELEAGALVVYNPDIVPGGSSEGGSGALVVYTGSPSKQARPEKEAVASGSGTGQAPGDKNRKKCSICGKEFASEKAVFGHMRLHRNRGWRGAHPPPVFNAEEEFADVPGLNLPLVIREEVVGEEEGRAAAVEAEEAERALVVERRRGIRIDLNVNLWKQAPDDTPDA